MKVIKIDRKDAIEKARISVSRKLYILAAVILLSITVSSMIIKYG